jgi:hypothetical protein
LVDPIINLIFTGAITIAIFWAVGQLLIHAVRVAAKRAGGIKGEVVKIGLRNSWLKTSAGSVVIISNSQIANGPLTNYSASERLLRGL